MNCLLSYRFFGFAFLMTALLTFSACRGMLEVVDPNVAFDSKQYSSAAALYEVEFGKAKDRDEKTRLATRIADCYRLSNKTVKAEKWYETALETSTDSEVAFQFGLMQKSNEKYKEAIRTFKSFAYNNPSSRARAQLQIQSCQLAQDWKEDKHSTTIFNLEQINSASSDYSPVFYEKDQLVFTSDRTESSGKDIYGWTGEKYSDLFVTTKKDSRNYSTPVFFSDTLNTVYNEGTATFTPDFSEMYFTRCGNPLEENAFCKIYYSKKKRDGGWTRPEQLELFDEVEVNLAQPFLSPNGSVLYFASDAEGGYGDKDIYSVKKSRDGWGYPVNLGPEINTAGYDGFPFLHVDGKLYFASNGHQGMGGLDVFSATRSGKRWVNAQNLQYPINSAADDFGLIFDPFVNPDDIETVEASGYVSSTRKGGKGADDIYRIVVEIPTEEPETPEDTTELVNADPVQIVMLKGLVERKKFEDPEDPSSNFLGMVPMGDAVVEVLGLELGSRVNERIISNSTGAFQLVISPNEEYKLTVGAADYFRKSETFRSPVLSENEDTLIYEVKISLDKIYEEKEVVVDNIYYDLDSDQIRADAQPTLNEIAQLMRENPSISLEFGAHTDSRGQKRYNQDLSQRRAQSVVDYLIAQNIAGDRMSARGYGESQLVNECADGVNCEEDQHQENRRTTFKVIGK